jgi:hypothetical protein
MPGLALILLVGQNIPSNCREMCFVRGSGNAIIVTTIIDKLLEDEAVKRYREILSGRKKSLPL